MDSIDPRRAAERAVRLTMERRPQLLAYARVIVGDHSLAEDVLQETLVVASGKAIEMSDQDFGRWITEVVRRTALDMLKKRKRDPRPLGPEILAALEVDWQAADGHWGADAREALRICLGKLSPKDRQFLEDRYGEDLTGAALAERSGLTVKSAYSNLTRIHQKLGACVRQALTGKERGL